MARFVFAHRASPVWHCPARDSWGILDPVRVEICEGIEVGEHEIMPLCDSDSDCFIIVDDPVMRLRWQSGEKTEDVATVFSQLGLTMREHEDSGIDCRPPRCNPITMCFDCLTGGSSDEGEFDISHAFFPFGVLGDCKKSGQDMVEIDGLPINEIVPF